MKQIVWISLNTVREHLRDKLFYNLAFFALLLIASAVILSRLTLGDYHRVLIDVGLASIHIIGIMIAVFLAYGLYFGFTASRICLFSAARVELGSTLRASSSDATPASISPAFSWQRASRESAV